MIDLREVVNALDREFLKQREFKRKGVAFSKFYPAGAQIVANVQKSRSSTQDSLIFTLNLGIVLVSLFKESFPDGYSRGSLEFPDESDWHYRSRIGHLVSDQTDLWWTIEHSRDIPSACATVAIKFEKALGRLEALASPEALIAAWKGGERRGKTDKVVREYLGLAKSVYPHLFAG